MLEKIKIDLDFEDYSEFLEFLKKKIEEKNRKALNLYNMALHKEIPKLWEKYLVEYKAHKYIELKKKIEKNIDS